jgi:TolA-binding protein
MQRTLTNLHADTEVPGAVRATLCSLVENGAHLSQQIEQLLSISAGQAQNTAQLHESIKEINRTGTETNRRIGAVESALHDLVTGKVNDLEKSITKVQHDMEIQKLEMERIVDIKLQAQAAIYDGKLKDAATAKAKSDEDLGILKTANEVQKGQLKLAYGGIVLLVSILAVVAAFLALRSDPKPADPVAPDKTSVHP